MKRIGILGGTFDPPHIGHLILAELAWEQLELDKVFFIPAYIPPHKKTRKCSSPRHRLNMVRIALKGNSHFDVLDIELKRKDVSYTVDTLRDLHLLFPQCKFFFLLGSDNFESFHTWREPETIATLAELVVYKRLGTSTSTGVKHWKYKQLEGPFIDISSTQIRARVAKGESIRYLVPQDIEQYIQRKKLYRRD